MVVIFVKLGYWAPQGGKIAYKRKFFFLLHQGGQPIQAGYPPACKQALKMYLGTDDDASCWDAFLTFPAFPALYVACALWYVILGVFCGTYMKYIAKQNCLHDVDRVQGLLS